jgi:transcriptional regulator with XRE-family HTH domain
MQDMHKERLAEGKSMAFMQEKIRKRRTELGITQADLAKRLGISQSFYSRLEKGVATLSADLLKRLAEALETDPAYFLDDEGMEYGNLSFYVEDTLDELEQLHRQQQFAEMLRLIQQAEKSHAFQLAQNRIRLLLWKARALSDAGDVGQSLAVVEETLPYQPVMSRLLLATTYEIIALNNARRAKILDVQHRYEERDLWCERAIHYFQTSLNLLSERHKSSSIYQRCLYQLGNTYAIKRDFGRAEFYFARTMEWLEKENVLYLRTKARILIDKSFMAEINSDYRLAIRYASQALRFSKQIKDIRGEIISCYNIFDGYKKLGDNQKAKQYLARCVELANQYPEMTFPTFLESLKNEQVMDG